MSIISDALKKASDERRNTVLRDSIRRENITRDSLSEEIRRISARKTRWHISGTVGTVFIVSFVVALFLYNAEYFYPLTAHAPKAALAPARPEIAPVIKIAPFKKEPPRESYSFVLNGVMKGAGEPLAIVNNKVVGAGDYVNGARVARIANDRVTLIYRNREIVLKIE